MLASDGFMLVFRIVHILAGVAWVGSVFLLVFFIQPSATAIGPAAAPFMTELLGKRRLVDRIIALAVFTVVAGLFMYWHDWHLYGSFDAWIRSRFGSVLTVGAVASIAALAIGVFGTRPSVQRFFALGREVAASGGPPSPEVGAEMAALQGRLRTFARVSLGLLIVAVFCMATARYA
jgi:uncharacterized membrane protein